MPRRSRGKISRVPKVPDILHPTLIELDKEYTNEEDTLEIIVGEKPSIKGPRFVQDLGMDKILQQGTELSFPNWKQPGEDRDWDRERRKDYTRATVSKIIEKIFTVPSDLSTANYRLAVFDYLLNNQEGFGNFSRVFQNLNTLIVQGLQRKSRNHEDDIWTRVSNYGLIFDITEHYMPFGKDAPEALQRMDAYFEALKKSHSHKKMGELAQKLSKPYDINLRIRIDPTNKDLFEYSHPWVVAASV